MYERGCTFYEANFCDGWDRTILEHVNCTTSRLGVPDVDDGAVDNSKAGSEQLSRSFNGWLMLVVLIVGKLVLQ